MTAVESKLPAEPQNLPRQSLSWWRLGLVYPGGLATAIAVVLVYPYFNGTGAFDGGASFFDFLVSVLTILSFVFTFSIFTFAFLSLIPLQEIRETKKEAEAIIIETTFLRDEVEGKKKEFENELRSLHVLSRVMPDFLNEMLHATTDVTEGDEKQKRKAHLRVNQLMQWFDLVRTDIHFEEKMGHAIDIIGSSEKHPSSVIMISVVENLNQLITETPDKKHQIDLVLKRAYAVLAKMPDSPI